MRRIAVLVAVAAGGAVPAGASATTLTATTPLAPNAGNLSAFSMVSVVTAPEGSVEECLQSTRQGGASLEEAVETCFKPPDAAGTEGRAAPDGSDPLSADDEDMPILTCDDELANPAGEDGGTAAPAKKPPTQPLTSEQQKQAAQAAAAGAQQAAKEAERIYEEAKKAAAADDEARVLELAKQHKTAVEQVKALAELAKNPPKEIAASYLFSDEGNFGGVLMELAAGNVPPGVKPGGKGTRRPVEGETSICDEAAVMIAACNQSGWKDPACVDLLEFLDDCPDRTIIIYGGDYRCGGAPTKEEADAAANHGTLLCEMYTNPAPGEDPCVPPKFGGEMAMVRTVNSTDVCNNPYVMNVPDSCFETTMVQLWTGPQLDDIAREAFEKLGGPPEIVTLGTNPSPPPGTGPQPEPGQQG